MVNHVKVFLFDSSDPNLAFLKATGEKYQVITSEANDSVFAIVDSKADAKIADKVGKLIEIALRESLGIESMQQVADFARKKQVQITDERSAVPLNEKL